MSAVYFEALLRFYLPGVTGASYAEAGPRRPCFEWSLVMRTVTS